MIQDFQIINKVMLICQIELKHEKERLVKTRKLLKEDVNICKKESSNITELRIELAVEKKKMSTCLLLTNMMTNTLACSEQV